MSPLQEKMLKRISQVEYFDVDDLSPEERRAADELVEAGLTKPLYNEHKWGGDGALVGWCLATEWWPTP